MFGLFKKQSPKEKLMKQYQELLQQAYQLSHSNRRASDQKTAEAEALLRKIEELN